MAAFVDLFFCRQIVEELKFCCTVGISGKHRHQQVFAILTPVQTAKTLAWSLKPLVSAVITYNFVSDDVNSGPARGGC